MLNYHNQYPIYAQRVKQVFLIPVLIVLLGSQSYAQIRTVVLDAGHGGKDPGAKGVTGALEKRINLKIVLALGKKMKETYPDIRVLYTRMGDTFIPIFERSNIANRNKADLFISVHCNAMDTKTYPKLKTYYGTETYVMGLHKTNENLEVAKRENAAILQESDYQKNYKGYDPNSPMGHILMANYQSAFLESSLTFASKIEREFKKTAERKSLGVKQAGFIVLWATAMPSVLVEAGYLSNKDEEAYLKTEEGQEAIAESIFRAFGKYKAERE